MNDFKNFLPEILTHQTVNVHVESSVNDQTKIADEDHDKSPRGKGVGHVVFGANVWISQSDDFMYVHGHSWKVTKHKTGYDDKENNCQLIVSLSPFVIATFKSLRRTWRFLLSEIRKQWYSGLENQSLVS